MRGRMARHAMLGVALAAAVVGPLAGQQDGAEPRPSPRGSRAPVDIVVRQPASQTSRAARYQEAAGEALELFETWLGPWPHPHLVVVSVPWDAPPRAAEPAMLAVPAPWVTLRGDRAADRVIIAGLARAYWFDVVRLPATDAWLASGLARFTAARAIHAIVDGDHTAAPRFFGDTLAYPVRRAPLSIEAADTRPYRRRFDEIDAVLADDPARQRRAVRAAGALQTLERYLGWPVVERALGLFAERGRSDRVSAADLEGVVSEAAGRDLSWFFADAWRPDAIYDYGIDGVQRDELNDGRHATTLTARRYGDAVFAGTSRAPIDGFDAGRAIELLVTFADGSEMREYWDGRDETRDFHFVSRAPLTAAALDPDAVLTLDANWRNNRIVLTGGVEPATLQWSLLWTSWLQGVLLTLTALV